MLDSALRIFCWSVPSAREIVIKLEMQSSIVSAVTALFHEFSANLGATPPLYAYAVPGAVLRQQQNKCLGNLVGVRGCEADASSRNIKQSALPTSKSAVESNLGIVVVPATAGAAILLIREFGAQPGADAEPHASLDQVKGQSSASSASG